MGTKKKYSGYLHSCHFCYNDGKLFVGFPESQETRENRGKSYEKAIKKNGLIVNRAISDQLAALKNAFGSMTYVNLLFTFKKNFQ